ncbi:hypothetical protein Ddye_018199 [Dipteronia dyeriana]|uniref:RRM domain-containing protein n=1 Tax=Dipteronia dyeriana TaxID=168575 RepID=A0AAD9UB27_9ROSI|nr:hypothetical protein Ddye_018199 [Dipteronia dyeriana]
MPEVGQYTAASLAKISSRLNPFAREWDIWTEQTPEEERTSFLTFAYGHPLTQSQIVRFFTNKYGQYVERVYVNWQEPSIYGPPLFGRIVFKASCIPLDVLNGYQQTRFMVYGKPLWCKKFRPMPNHFEMDSFI